MHITDHTYNSTSRILQGFLMNTFRIRLLPNTYTYIHTYLDAEVNLTRVKHSSKWIVNRVAAEWTECSATNYPLHTAVEQPYT